MAKFIVETSGDISAGSVEKPLCETLINNVHVKRVKLIDELLPLAGTFLFTVYLMRKIL